MRNVYKIVVGKPSEKRTHWKLGHRGENNIKMDLRGIGCEDGG
jgi:hypothetical protein